LRQAGPAAAITTLKNPKSGGAIPPRVGEGGGKAAGHKNVADVTKGDAIEPEASGAIVARERHERGTSFAELLQNHGGASTAMPSPEHKNWTIRYNLQSKRLNHYQVYISYF